MKASLKATIFILFVLLASTSNTLASSKLDNAIHLYQAKDYGKALASFTDIYRSTPTNPTAYCYAANCHYALRQKSEAINLYWYVVKTFPSSKEAYSSRAFLKQIDTSYAKNSYKNGSNWSPNDTVSKAETAKKAIKEPVDPAAINSIVKIIQAQANRPDVSAELIKEAKSLLATYPAELINEMQRHGTKIYLTPTMIDKEPGLQNTKPRGYENGSTYKNCPGMFSYPNIIICAYALKGSDDESWEPTSDPIGTLRHELGHAFDSYMGRVSETEEFKHAYYLDCGTVEEEAKNQLSYYLQKAEGGPSETFAELFCCKYGGSTVHKEHSAIVQSSFPRCMAIINKLIAKLE